MSHYEISPREREDEERRWEYDFGDEGNAESVSEHLREQLAMERWKEEKRA